MKELSFHSDSNMLSLYRYLTSTVARYGDAAWYFLIGGEPNPSNECNFNRLKNRLIYAYSHTYYTGTVQVRVLNLSINYIKIVRSSNKILVLLLAPVLSSICYLKRSMELNHCILKIGFLTHFPNFTA